MKRHLKGLIKFAKRARNNSGFPSFDGLYTVPKKSITPDDKNKHLFDMLGPEAYSSLKKLNNEDIHALAAESRQIEEDTIRNEQARKVREQREAEEVAEDVERFITQWENTKNSPVLEPIPSPTDAELASDSSWVPQPTEDDIRNMLYVNGELDYTRDKQNTKSKAQIQSAKTRRFIRNNKLPLALLLSAGLGYGGYLLFNKLRKRRKYI